MKSSDFLTNFVSKTTTQVNDFDDKVSKILNFSDAFQTQIDVMKRVQSEESITLNKKISSLSVEVSSNYESIQINKTAIMKGVDSNMKQCIG